MAEGAAVDELKTRERTNDCWSVSLRLAVDNCGVRGLTRQCRTSPPLPPPPAPQPQQAPSPSRCRSGRHPRSAVVGEGWAQAASLAPRQRRTTSASRDRSIAGSAEWPGTSPEDKKRTRVSVISK